MLAKVVSALARAGDSGISRWLQSLGSGDPIISVQVEKKQLVVSSKSNETSYSQSDLITNLENGDPEETVPALYAIARCCEVQSSNGIVSSLDQSLTQYCKSLVSGITDSQLAWYAYDGAVLTSVASSAKQPDSKTSKKLLVKKIDGGVRLIFLSHPELRGLLLTHVREGS